MKIKYFSDTQKSACIEYGQTPAYFEGRRTRVEDYDVNSGVINSSYFL